MNVPVTQRITINATTGKNFTPRVFERTLDLEVKGLVSQPADEDLHPLHLIKEHAFGETVWVFFLDHFDGKIAHYRPVTYPKSAALLQNIHKWGFQEVQP